MKILQTGTPPAKRTPWYLADSFGCQTCGSVVKIEQVDIDENRASVYAERRPGGRQRIEWICPVCRASCSNDREEHEDIWG